MDPSNFPLPLISAWDPRATSAGSIDPLGALRAYNAIAGFLLPGVTTITTRVRYLTWLCAGLRLLDETIDAPSGGRAGRSRRQRLLAWERFVALATGRFAVSIGAASDAAVWRGLRGVSYVRRAIEQGTTSTDYQLLRNQAGVGGVGTYWVTLVNGALVEDLPAELTTRGIQLADELLKRLEPRTREYARAVLANKPQSFSEADLAHWGKVISLDLSGTSKAERRSLQDALVEPKAHRYLAAALECSADARSDHEAFQRLERRLRARNDDSARQIASVMELTRAFEALHSTLLDPFDRLRMLNGRGAPVAVRDAANAVGDLGPLRDANAQLTELLRAASHLPQDVGVAVRQFHGSVQGIVDAQSPAEMVDELCRHHERVQSGKLDASRQPKQPWVHRQAGSIVISPRFSIIGPWEPRHPSAFTHPYRIEAFGGMLAELGMIVRAR